MNCESVVKLIPLYFYGELPPDEEDQFEQHVDACAACAREVDAQRQVSAELDRRAMEPSAALLAECRHDLMRAVYRQEATTLRSGSADSSPRPASHQSWRETLAPGFRRWGPGACHSAPAPSSLSAS